MRVIAGKHRGRVLAEFKGREVRPTSDRAKEALFNILQGKTAGASFLDLFCGTGSIGIEALSRVAAKATLVDNSKESVKIAEKNLNALGEKADIVLCDAEAFIKRTSERFDIIFLDPPYKLNVSALLDEIGRRDILSDGGVVIYEHDENNSYSSEKLLLVDSRRYGIAQFDFYKRNSVSCQ
ncbi:MAG: 16S rRNA (guanine(966)-N(2))-methyltransferase RsmD [Clostridia bacterium]|nr:16S rRNA (guanine(966)-N(2))-methyltransferase RsmD [Clostridia bacterium]